MTPALRTALVSALLVVFAGAFVLFAWGLPDRGTPGDVHGYDPGSRAMTLMAGLALAAFALLALARDLVASFTRREPAKDRPAAAADGPVAGAPIAGAPLLVAVYGGLCILFVAALRPIGFFPASGVLVFVLILANRHAMGARPAPVATVLWTLALLALLLASEALIGALVHALYAVARHQAMPALAQPHVQAWIVIATMSALFVGLAALAHRLPGDPMPRQAALIGLGLALGVYVVFRLLFQVPFPAGPTGSL